MEGYIDEYGHPKVVVMVNGLSVDAVVDTGFDGNLCLPIQVAIQLGLKLCDTMKVELADGSIKRELVFMGLIKFGGEAKKARITLTESTDALMGTQMFSYLEIDIEGNKVRIK